MLGLLCPVVVAEGTELVREHEAQVEPLVAQRIGKPAGNVRFGMLLQRNGMSIFIVLRNLLHILSIGIQRVGIELRRTGFGVDSCKLYHIEGTVRATNLMNLRATDNLCLFTVQLHNLVAVVRQGEGSAPVKVLCNNILRIDFQFHTLVLHFTDVHQVRAEAGSHGYGAVHQKVLRGTGVVFQRKVHPIEDAEVQTDVQVVVRFPLQVAVLYLRLNKCRVLHISATQTSQAHVSVQVRRQGSVHTVRGTEFQVSQPIACRLHKVFFDYAPCAGY